MPAAVRAGPARVLILRQVTPPTDAFEQAIGQLMAREFDESPRMASVLGRDGFDLRLDDLSATGFERRAADDATWADRFRTFYRPLSRPVFG